MAPRVRHEVYFHPKPKKPRKLTKYQQWLRAENKALKLAKKTADNRTKAIERSKQIWQQRSDKGKFTKKLPPVTKGGKIRIHPARQRISNLVKEVWLETDLLPPPDFTATRKKKFRKKYSYDYSYQWRLYGIEGQELSDALLTKLVYMTAHGWDNMMTMVSIYMGTDAGANGSVGSPVDFPQKTLAYLRYWTSLDSSQVLIKESNGEIVFVVTARTQTKMTFK